MSPAVVLAAAATQVYAAKEVKALEALARLLAEEFETQRQIRQGGSGIWESGVLQARAMGAADRRLQSLSDFKALGYTKILWLRSERGEVREVRLTPAAEMFPDPYIRALDHRVARYFGREDVELGESRRLDLAQGGDTYTEEWTLVGRATVRDCRIDIDVVHRSDITHVSYELAEDGVFAIDGLRATMRSPETAAHRDGGKSSDSAADGTRQNERQEDWWWSTLAEAGDTTRNLEALEAWVLTNATQAQRDALEQVRGLVHIPGVAGSGKTIFAMGRLRSLKNLFLGDRTVPAADGEEPIAASAFDPSRMVAFVGSPSLRTYLDATSRALALDEIAIRDFSEFYREQLVARELNRPQPFQFGQRLAPSDAQQAVGWVRALDSLIAVTLAREWASGAHSLSSGDDLPLDLTAVALSLQAQPSGSFRLQGLLKRIESIIESNAERALRALIDASPAEEVRSVAVDLVRRRAAAIEIRGLRKTLRPLEDKLAKSEVGEGSDRESLRKRIADLKRELGALGTEEGRARFEVTPDQVRREAPRARRRLAITARKRASKRVESALYAWKESVCVKLDALRLDVVLAEAVKSLDSAGTPSAVAALQERLVAGTLVDADRKALVCLYALCSRGATWTARGRWRDVADRSAVFIDEVQDFSEVDVLLMGLCASPETNCVTLVGDDGQQLHGTRTISADHWCPHIAERYHTPLLDKNFRQSEFLGDFSSSFRRLFLPSAQQAAAPPAVARGPLPIFYSPDPSDLAAAITDRVSQLPYGASLAVILPEEAAVREWHERLVEPLGNLGLETMLSERDRLIERFVVHFTTPRDAKGLQFTACVIPDIARFDAACATTLRHLYVALTRPRKSLFLGTTADLSQTPLSALLESGMAVQRSAIRPMFE